MNRLLSSGVVALALGSLLAGACSRAAPPAGAPDGGGGGDAGDAGRRDAGGPDASIADAGGLDAGRTDAAWLDAGVPDTGNCPPEATPCSSAAGCDDCNPRTMDSCYTPQGICIHVIDECRIWSDCDDTNPLTNDECRHDLGMLDWICEHTLASGRCETQADCDDGQACSVEQCVENVCRYQVPQDCVVSCEPYPLCGTGDVLGAPCGSLPVARPDCLVSGAGTCAQLRLCGETFYPGFAAGPDCASAPCPVDPPSTGDACGTQPVRCDYGTRPGETCSTETFGPTSRAGSPFSGTHPPGHPQCDCRDGMWACTVDACPLTPPQDGDPVDPAMSGRGADCVYQSRLCSIRADPAPLNTFRWRCVYPRACPLVAVDGAACSHAQDDFCGYQRTSGAQPATQYSGDCTCGTDNLWHCTTNSAADCPLAAPDGGFCTPTAGTGNCVYYDGDSTTVTFRCNCSGAWNCAAQ